jgi:hypothetical protein
MLISFDFSGVSFVVPDFVLPVFFRILVVQIDFRCQFHSKNICTPSSLLQAIKVNICPFPLPHFGSIFFAYL